MELQSCVITRGRVIKVRSRGREYARISVRDSKELLKYAGTQVTVVVIINKEGGDLCG